MEIQLVRQDYQAADPAQLDAALLLLMSHVDGLGAANAKRWRRFWRRALAMEPGEVMDVESTQARLSWYHRRHMAPEQALFASQERFQQFERFRDWLKLGAGHVDWTPTPAGMVPTPKSIRYSRMEQGAMESFHGACVDFVRTEYAGRTLWPHLRQTARIEMIEGILEGFGE